MHPSTSPPDQVDISSIAETLGDLLDVDEQSLRPDTELAAVEGWDSVNALRVLVYLERELGTPIDYEAFAAATTVGELAAVCGAA